MDFDFGTSEPPKDENNNNQNNPSQPNQQNNDGFFNMDFNSNPSESQPKTTLDDMLNMNFNSNEGQSIPQSNNFQSMDIDNKTRNIHPDNLTLIPKQYCESHENININKPVNDGNTNRIDNNYEKNKHILHK